jgi:hypothetical protein
MAHDALAKSRNPDLRRLAATINVAQRHEIIQLRCMLNHGRQPMFATRAAAEMRAQQLKCSGAFAIGDQWMPCQQLNSYKKAVSAKKMILRQSAGHKPGFEAAKLRPKIPRRAALPGAFSDGPGGCGDLVDQGATFVGIRSVFNNEKRLCLRLMLPAGEGTQGFAAAVLGIHIASNAQIM